MKKIKEFVAFTQKHKSISYNEELKKKFKSLGRSALKEVLNSIGPVVESEISYNPGGIAVSGDFHLKVMFAPNQGVDVFFNLDGFGNYITYRCIKELKDYSGGCNQNIPFEKLLDLNNLSAMFINESKKVK